MAKTTTDESIILKALEGVIKCRIREIIEEEKEKASERISAAIGKEVDAIALSVLTHYSVERHGLDVVIRVTKPTTVKE